MARFNRSSRSELPTEGNRFGGDVHLARFEDGLSDGPHLADGVIQLGVAHPHAGRESQLKGQIGLGHALTAPATAGCAGRRGRSRLVSGLLTTSV